MKRLILTVAIFAAKALATPAHPWSPHLTFVDLWHMLLPIPQVRLPGPGGTGPGGASVTLINHTCTTGAFSSTPINTIGADFYVAVVSHYNTATFGISDSNVWTPLNQYGASTTNVLQISYSENPTTSSSYTFTIAGNTYSEACVAAFSGIKTIGSFQTGTDSGATNASAATLQPGSITPSGNTLLISGAGEEAAASYAINNSFTIIDSVPYSSGINLGAAIAYLVQPTGFAINPTWTFGSAVTVTVGIAGFSGN